MEYGSSPPPLTGSPIPVAQAGGEGIAERPNELVLPRIPIAAVEDEIADSVAESGLSNSVASSPAAWDPKKLSSAIATRRRGAPPQDPDEPSSTPIATEKRYGGKKRLHAALAPVGDDADADLRAKRRKLVLTLQDAEEDGLTNWYTQSILYRERIEHPASLRDILDQALERGTSYLSRAEVESITAEDQTSPSPPPVPSEPGETPRHPLGWTPINRVESEEDEDNSYDEDGSQDAAHRADNPVLADDNDTGNDADVKDEEEDEDEDGNANANANGTAVLLPEVGDCFRARTYGGGHPGTTWAALVQPLMHEDYLANMRAGKKVMALRRAREKEMATTSATSVSSTSTTATSIPTAAASASKKRNKPPPQTPSRKNNKRQKREREEEEVVVVVGVAAAAAQSPAGGKTDETGDELVVTSPSPDTSAGDRDALAPPPSPLPRAVSGPRRPRTSRRSS